MSDLNSLLKELKSYKNPKKAKLLAGYFKTGKGQYGEGDIFLGIMLPTQRLIAKKYTTLSFGEIRKLLQSKVHECRLVALLILVEQYRRGDALSKKKIATFYLANTKRVNNWDLVDLSADKILGEYLRDKDRNILYQLARSKNIWERRISILSTFAFIREGEYKDTFKISEILLSDSHDLIHKAVGWFLREVGKKDQVAEERFLKKHIHQLPRTTLRYAIERFDEAKRKKYMSL